MMTLEQIIEREQSKRTEGGSFGITACKESIQFYLEHGSTLEQLLDEYVKRANEDVFFNKAMVLACWEMIEEKNGTVVETPREQADLNTFTLIEEKTIGNGYLFQRWEGIGYEMTVRQYSPTGYDIHVTPDKECSRFIPWIYVFTDDEGDPTQVHIETTSYGSLPIDQYAELQRAMTLAICAAEDVEKHIAHLVR